jgi:hypothetical protein
MESPNKLYIAAKLFGKSVCEKADGFYYWEGNDEASTQKLTSSELAQVDTEYAALQNEYATTEYQRKRALEYPPITDYLDGVAKGDQAQIDKYIADCLAVKAKYPKGAA